ncbi:hypothetical protein BGZ65_010121, partial [Modicella reniformis]
SGSKIRRTGAELMVALSARKDVSVAMLAEELEDGDDVLYVFCLGFGIDLDVIKVDDYPLVESRVEGLEHHIGKYCRGIVRLLQRKAVL